MSKSKKEYVYQVNERSIDVRYFEIVSDKKLTHNEVIEAMCLPDISKEGDSKKEGGITSTFMWTDFGETEDVEVLGELKDE
tara:strand:- start:266 stop:508 length:243 start_codon:yes stop_codon:yes gene_type:complete